MISITAAVLSGYEPAADTFSAGNMRVTPVSSVSNGFGTPHTAPRTKTPNLTPRTRCLG